MKTALAFLFMYCMATVVWAQSKAYQRSFQIKTTDVVKVTNPPVAQPPPTHIFLKPSQYYVLHPQATKDTILEKNLSLLYQDKGCPVDKSLTGTGCVSLKYADGTQRIMCDKQYEAVITPDGKVHLPIVMTAYSLTFPLTPPALPTDQTILKWLTNYNDDLLKNLLSYAAEADRPKLKSDILAKEKSMKLDIYGQVVNRANLLEQFASLR